jgi:hypothetical protein
LVAIYNSTFSNFCPAGLMLRDAYMDATGSPMRSATRRSTSPASRSRWRCTGPQSFAECDVCLLVGANTLVSM